MLAQKFEEQALKLGEYIKNSKKILLVTHIRMDPDAYGSIWAFLFILEKLWKEVYATNDEADPESFLFLSKRKFVDPDLDLEKLNPDLIISLDAADEKQLWWIFVKFNSVFKKTPLVVIDHHITNPAYWNVNIIDAETSSACEIGYEVLVFLWLGKYIDPTVATLLLSGIHSDTNTFYNANTSANTLRVSAELIEKWARNKEIIFELFRKRNFEKMKLWGKVFSDIKSYSDWMIVWASVKKEMYNGLDIADQWLKWLMNEFIANIEWVKIWFLLFELWDNKVKASLRSNDNAIDVAQVCSNFWWGWHKLAAWFTYIGEIEELETILTEKLKKVL